MSVSNIAAENPSYDDKHLSENPFANRTESEAKQMILSMTEAYYQTFHQPKAPYQEGDRIAYASRVYDAEEMKNLVDSALEFWLTSGRYTEQFEKEFAQYIGVRYCSLVNSGSSANLLAFMALTSPLYATRTSDSAGR